MTSRLKLEKVLDDLKKNPYFDKYAQKIAKFQETSPDEFIERIETQEKKAREKKVAAHLTKSGHIKSLWTFPYSVTKAQPLAAHIRKNNFSDYAAKTTYITTPIFYVNDGPHIGHLYTAVLADAITRFNAMQGNSVFLCTGTDEHGTKIEKAANTAALPVLEHCSKISNQFECMCKLFNVQYSKFIRTTEKRHEDAVHHFWDCLKKKEHIYLDKYAGWYSVSDEAFISDLEVTENKDQAGNIVQVCTESGNPVEWTEEDTYKFRLTSFQNDLKYWLKNENTVQPAKYRETLLKWIEEGLQDLSISRPISRVPWAIPVPSDESHTIYVWLDALVNYLTAVGYPDSSYRHFWPPTIQIIGKDILKFHGIFWPAFLMAVGLEPPQKLLCHGHWTVDYLKMSKSKGNVISPFEAMATFTSDGLRYFLLRQAVLDADANYNVVQIRRLLNAELANTLGNLLNRCLSQCINPNKRIPHPAQYINYLKSDIALANIEALELLGGKVKQLYDKCDLHYAVDAIMKMLFIANEMFNHHEPWHLRKYKNPDSIRELEAVISLSLESVRVSALLLYPIVPMLSSKILDMLKVPTKNRTWEDTKPLHITHSMTEERTVSDKKIVFNRVGNYYNNVNRV
ncbi:methionyl-tRNA synthetase, mitochondrial isoform X2 [Calliopsis andreniformis]